MGEVHLSGDQRSSTVAFPPRTDVLGVPISMTSYAQMLALVDRRPRDRATVVAVCNVHSVMSARRDPALWDAIASADVSTTDGVPLVWYVRATVRPEQTRVYGPDLMRAALPHGVDRGWRHYLYGTTDETLDRLQSAIDADAPGAVVAGRTAPPFRPLTQAEEDTVVADVRASGADILWVSLGMPRQELFMQQVAHRLPGVMLIGVGAAFDLLSGTVPQAPAWLQRIGMEWLFRLWQEPRRLWRRYLLNNPQFAVLAVRDVLRHRFARPTS